MELGLQMSFVCTQNRRTKVQENAADTEAAEDSDTSSTSSQTLACGINTYWLVYDHPRGTSMSAESTFAKLAFAVGFHCTPLKDVGVYVNTVCLFA
jgi:hypothetical protein